MTSAIALAPPGDNVGELLARLGDIPPHRVLLRPAPGTATEADVVAMDDHHDRLCELVDGTLVEKGMGLRESLLAIMLAEVLNAFVRPRNLGLVSGEAGMMRILPGLVRIPDVAYVSWARVPGGRVPAQPVPHMAPDLAVEVLSESNTPREMARKRQEYFAAGGALVWEVNPQTRTVSVYSAPDRFVTLREADALDGGDVLPGFSLRLSELFAELDRQAPQ
jgi:Uma2 family endonuclease